MKVAAAGPLAGFGLGFVLLLLGFILPPADQLGLIVDPSVFHESLLVGGIGNCLLCHHEKNTIILVCVSKTCLCFYKSLATN